MVKNEGTADRLVRMLVLAPALVLVAVLLGIGTVGGVIAMLLAVVMLITGAVGFCPLYALVHVRTDHTAHSTS